MNWQTLLDGLGFLRQQISEREPVLSPDVFVGINSVGLFIASYLSRALAQVGRGTVLGYIETSGDEHTVKKEALPSFEPAKAPDCVLLVDSELKSGKSITHASEAIRAQYGRNIDIKIAALVAAKVGKVEKSERPGEITIERLLTKGGSFQEINCGCLPDFLVFVADSRITFHSIMGGPKP